MEPRPIRPEEYYNTIGVEDYYDKIHRTTWARRTAGMAAGGTLGMLFGGTIGAVGAFLPVTLGALSVAGASIVALPAIGAVASSAALFAIIGSGLGITLNTDVASNSASVAAGLEEMEKRHKVERLQDATPVQGTAPAQKDDLPMTATYPPKVQLFNWKVAVATASLFAVFGAVLAFTPLVPAAVMFGLGAHSAAAVISSAAMFGMFGSLLAVKNSLITNKTNNFFFKLITNQYFEKPPEKVLSATPAMAVAPQVTAPVEPEIAPTRKTSFVDTVQRTGATRIIADKANPEATKPAPFAAR